MLLTKTVNMFLLMQFQALTFKRKLRLTEELMNSWKKSLW